MMVGYLTVLEGYEPMSMLKRSAKVYPCLRTVDMGALT